MGRARSYMRSCNSDADGTPSQSCAISASMRRVICSCLSAKGGKIRLCKVKLSYNDLVANKEWYVLVEHDAWIHQVPANVMCTFEIRELQNGIIELFIVSHALFYQML